MSIQITGEAENVPSVINFLENVSDRYPQHGPSLQAPPHAHTHTVSALMSWTQDSGYPVLKTVVLHKYLMQGYSEINGKNRK